MSSSHIMLRVGNIGDCLRLRLCDTWLREFQTLPGRVHPEMFMSTSGGFLLLGIYVGIITPSSTISNTTATSSNTTSTSSSIDNSSSMSISSSSSSSAI